MSLFFPTLQPRCTLEYTAKTANHLFSRALTTHNSQRFYSYRDLISSTNQTPYCNNENNSNDLGHLTHLQQHGFVHNNTPYVLNKLVSLCAKLGSLHLGVQLQCTIMKLGFCSNVFITTALVDMYGKCGVISQAQRLFDEMPLRNVVTWNSLISGYLNTQYPEMAVELFIEMLQMGIALTPFSVSAALVGCAQLEAEEMGAQVHGLSLKSRFGIDVVVGTSLIDMYSKCLKIEASRKVFNGMPDRNVVTWTSMVSGYSLNQQPYEAMVLVRDMLCLGLKANYMTYSSLLSSFCDPDDFDHCKQVHCRIIREGLESNAYLAVSLMTIYSECSSNSEDFHKICSTVIIWDQISWNAVIAGFSNMGNGEEALVCFSKMRKDGISADSFTLASILKAMGIIAGLEDGKQSHGLVFKTGYASNLHVQNGLVSMYAKCGKIDDAEKVFSSMVEHDIVSWNSLLSAYAHHGCGRKAVALFEQMRRTVVKPDLTTFLAVLSACSHVGLLDKGLEYFDLMLNDDSLHPPKVEHYACIVDLYGRAGYLHEAEAFIHSMLIEPGPSVFKALLSACQVHGNKEIAERSAQKLIELCPNDPATYVLLSNVMASGEYWDDAAGVRKLMCDRGVMNKPAYSWI